LEPEVIADRINDSQENGNEEDPEKEAGEAGGAEKTQNQAEAHRHNGKQGQESAQLRRLHRITSVLNGCRASGDFAGRTTAAGVTLTI